MKLTNKNITAYVRQQLSTNPVWAVKALIRIFQENQTQDEQVIEATKEDNGIGFTGTDGQILSSFAKQQLARGTLSPKQMVIVFKKMPKYHRQVIAMSNTEQLNKLVEAAS
jgi:hypothetical protein